LTRAVLRWWLDWSPSSGLQWGLNWLTPSTLWRRLESLAPNALRRRLGWLALQWRFRTGLAHLYGASLNGRLTERLLHAWTEDSNHHLFERTKESSVVPAQDVVRSISERLHAFLPLLLGCGVALPWQQYPGHLIFQVRDATPVLLEGQQTLLLELIHGVLELLPLLRREVFNVDIHDISDVRHLDFRLLSH
jgi:hypothetical protein